MELTKILVTTFGVFFGRVIGDAVGNAIPVNTPLGVAGPQIASLFAQGATVIAIQRFGRRLVR